ncbi:Conserved_hypothetical protein [Hexamita inflata]|uniref:Uncharacterized protein n=1 Tax=Hexamita inflata TaxID=28002 RepID=A0AA86PDX9_9EUKA|nr:Conserved hypothetical protein [Hexamita inflata]
MEDLLAKSIKLLNQKSIYNKTDSQIKSTVQLLYQFVFDSQKIRPNILKLIRFCDEVDPTGFQKLFILIQKLREEYLNKMYRDSLRTIQQGLENVKMDANFQAKDTQQKYITQLQKYNVQTNEQNLKVVGLQQAKLRYQEVLKIYQQLQVAASMLNQSASSKTVLEQKYFHQEFAKLAKKLKVKFLQDYAQSQDSFDLHNTMLISDMKSQIIQNDNLQHHKALFIKCFGLEKFYETYLKACIEYIEQQFHFYSQLNNTEMNELDMFEFIFDLVKFLSLIQYQLVEQRIEIPSTNSIGEVSQTHGSTTNHDKQLTPTLFCSFVLEIQDRIQQVCLRFFAKVANFYQSQTMFSITAMSRMLMLLTKCSLQIENLFHQLQEYIKLINQEKLEENPDYVPISMDPKQINLTQQQIYKHISSIIKLSIKHFRDRLKQKFVVDGTAFDRWISIEHSNDMFNSIQMQELQDVDVHLDIERNFQLINDVDRFKKAKSHSEQTLYVSFVYAYSFNETMSDYVEKINTDPNFIKSQKQKDVSIQNISIIPRHFYQTLSYTNEFLYFLQKYDADFNVSLIIGSTIMCATRLINPPIVLQKNRIQRAADLPFILDECLLISQIKIISVFAELVEYERQMFSYYLRLEYPDIVETYIRPVIRKMLAFQINFRAALRSVNEYNTTTTVTKGSKIIFDQFLYFSRISGPFVRISSILMSILIDQLELNLIDHYSYIEFTDCAIEVVQQEIDYFQQSFQGIFKLDAFYIVKEFVQLVYHEPTMYTEFKKKYGDKFEPIKFKELMMRMADQNFDRERAISAVRKFADQ